LISFAVAFGLTLALGMKQAKKQQAASAA
jgi:hypothetical protein